MRHILGYLHAELLKDPKRVVEHPRRKVIQFRFGTGKYSPSTIQQHGRFAFAQYRPSMLAVRPTTGIRQCRIADKNDGKRTGESSKRILGLLTEKYLSRDRSGMLCLSPRPASLSRSPAIQMYHTARKRMINRELPTLSGSFSGSISAIPYMYAVGRRFRSCWERWTATFSMAGVRKDLITKTEKLTIQCTPVVRLEWASIQKIGTGGGHRPLILPSKFS